MQELGEHIDQRGSIVLPDRLRFDFSHSKVVEAAAMKRIEDMCIQHISRDLPVHSRETPLDQAKQINGEALCHPLSLNLLHLSSLLLCVSKEVLDLACPGLPILGLPEPDSSQTEGSEVLLRTVCPVLRRCHAV